MKKLCLNYGCYLYKDNFYKILGEVQFKCPTTREWIKATQYVQLFTGCDIVFVRENKDFLKKFKSFSLKGRRHAMKCIKCSCELTDDDAGNACNTCKAEKCL